MKYSERPYSRALTGAQAVKDVSSVLRPKPAIVSDITLTKSKGVVKERGDVKITTFIQLFPGWLQYTKQLLSAPLY